MSALTTPVTRRGNFGSNYGTNIQTGSGVGPRKLPFGHSTIIGRTAGEQAAVSVSEVFNTIQQGSIFIQPTGTSVTVQCTLAPMDLAANPDTWPTEIWTQGDSVGNGEIFLLPTLFTSLLITFNQPGLVYIAAI